MHPGGLPLDAHIEKELQFVTLYYGADFSNLLKSQLHTTLYFPISGEVQ